MTVASSHFDWTKKEIIHAPRNDRPKQVTKWNSKPIIPTS